MCEKEVWFEGLGFEAVELSDFCREWDFDQLYDAINHLSIDFPAPLKCFSDDRFEPYIVVPVNHPRSILKSEISVKDLCGYTDQELAEMIFKRLAGDWLSLETYQTSKGLDHLSETEFKEVFIDQISEAFYWVELCSSESVSIHEYR